MQWNVCADETTRFVDFSETVCVWVMAEFGQTAIFPKTEYGQKNQNLARSVFDQNWQMCSYTCVVVFLCSWLLWACSCVRVCVCFRSVGGCKIFECDQLLRPDQPSAGPALREIAQLVSLSHRKFRSFFPLLGLLVELWPRFKTEVHPNCAFGVHAGRQGSREMNPQNPWSTWSPQKLACGDRVVLLSGAQARVGGKKQMCCLSQRCINISVDESVRAP